MKSSTGITNSINEVKLEIILEKSRVSSKPLKFVLYKDGRDELGQLVLDTATHARLGYARKLMELGIINFSRLDIRKQKILELRFIEGKTLEEVGQHFGVTRERIRYLEASAIEELKTY